MLLRIFKLFMLFILVALALGQAFYLYHHWLQVPRADVAHWRIEYASLNLEAESSHVLQMQLRAESSQGFKKSALPDVEVVLTDTLGEPVAYRQFLASEWVTSQLPRKNDWLTFGVASQTEITIEIPLEIPKAASGFQVHLLYSNKITD